MSDPTIDVVGIGNAIVDVISRTDDDFLVEQELIKGSMRLIDDEEAERLYDHMGPAMEISGGSAANSIAGVASFGGEAGFVGTVRDDALGQVFAHDIRAAGVQFATEPLGEGPATARSLILVSPDGERTMNTFLGAAQLLGPDAVAPDLIRSAGILYLEGYLWDPPAAKDAFKFAAGIAREAGREVALTLSDAFCVDRYRDEFRELIASKAVTLLFGNESELHSLYQTGDLESAMTALKADCDFAVVTRGEEGATVLHYGEEIFVPAWPVDQVVDLTGAGDLFAAGFLFGLSRGQDSQTCARLGTLAAAEVISHIGARPQVSLKDLAAENGFSV